MLKRPLNEYQRFLLFVLIFMLCVSMIFVSAQPAQAVVVAVVPVACYALAAALGLAAGIQFTTEDGIKGWAQECWNDLSAVGKAAWQEFVDTEDTAFTVSGSMWEFIEGVRERLRAGEIEEMTYFESSLGSFYSFIAEDRLTAYPNYLTPGAYLGNYEFEIHGHLTVVNEVKIYAVPGSGGSQFELVRFTHGRGWEDGTWNYKLWCEAWNGSNWIEIGRDENLGTNDVTLSVACSMTSDGYTITSNTGGISDDEVWKLNGLLSGGGCDLSISVDTEGEVVVPVTGNIEFDNSICSDEVYDLTGHSITVPQDIVGDISQAVGADATDVPIDITLPLTDITGELGTQTGWLAAIWQQVKNIAGSLSTSITNFFDLSRPINLDPLDMSGQTFTNKFPFSLPWDLYNSFSSLETSGVAPDWEIEFMGAEIDFSLDLVDDYIPTIKLIELVLFDIGLILATRRLLGGAA